MFDFAPCLPPTPSWCVLSYFLQRNFRLITYAVISSWNENRVSFVFLGWIIIFEKTIFTKLHPSLRDARVANLEPSRTSTMELFCENSSKTKIVQKSSLVDAWLDLKCACDTYLSSKVLFSAYFCYLNI